MECTKQKTRIILLFRLFSKAISTASIIFYDKEKSGFFVTDFFACLYMKIKNTKKIVARKNKYYISIIKNKRI